MIATAETLGPERAQAIDVLRQRFGDRLATGHAIREQHGKGESYHPPALPDAVVFAHTTEEVQEVVQLCARHKIPVIPFGTGTSLEGHVQALEGGISIDVSQMNAVLEVNAEDLDAGQAGVTRKQLNEHLRDTGLFFPIDPGADASLGGMTATRASGTNAVRYGTMRENVLSLTVVTADGRIINTARRSRKSSAGYDLTRLFVGSEGTLGVITEVSLRVYGIPEAISSAVCQFPSLEAAVETVIRPFSGVPVARIELLDDVQMAPVSTIPNWRATNANRPCFLTHVPRPGSANRPKQCAPSPMNSGRPSDGQQGRGSQPLWQARHDAYYAALSLKPGSKGWASMFACRSRASPSVSWRPKRNWMKWACWRRWSAMSATAISICPIWLTATTPSSWPRPRNIMSGWSPAPWRWAAPAPASMASATAKFTICSKSMARLWP